MTRVKRDRSERAFLYFIMVLIGCMFLMVFYEISKVINIMLLAFILGALFFRMAHLTGRPEADLDVIRRIEKENK